MKEENEAAKASTDLVKAPKAFKKDSGKYGRRT
jgi:hypothetical protein